MKKKRKRQKYRMTYEQEKAQQKLDDWIPKPVIPWEEKLKERPEPGTKDYIEWWKTLTHEQQLLELEYKRRERDAKQTKVHLGDNNGSSGDVQDDNKGGSDDDQTRSDNGESAGECVDEKRVSTTGPREGRHTGDGERDSEPSGTCPI